MALRFVVPPGQPALRLDAYLSSTGQLSRRQARTLVEKGSVFVNKKRVVAAQRMVEPGDAIQVNFLLPTRKEVDIRPLTILHEDAWMVVVDKPAGMPSEPTRQSSEGTVLDAVERHLKDAVMSSGLTGGSIDARPRIVHRLDREVTGVMVVGLGKQASAQLNLQLRQHTARRRYLAITLGEAPTPGADLTHLMAKGKDGMVVSEPAQGHHRGPDGDEDDGDEPDPAQKLAITHYKVKARAPGVTLVEVELETGRTHQIRAQLAFVGLPLLGDTRYGGMPAEDNPLSEVALTLGRPALHAWKMSLRHPHSNQNIHFDAVIPADFRAACTRLGLTLP